ncbi:PKD domain-containing protein [Larkinella humicola]|uniref:T9SS type B sorting domain-containing protein n=1 Tax=Larkinella humicola TaxID=2607654 RepID=A0A5N1JFZ3_9BACT|nr:PKD domain-containing protein [Larkinella humicola]KAA9354015.1 T9SS type B sorting domain-containing protein [Larkinella humicola]
MTTYTGMVRRLGWMLLCWGLFAGMARAQSGIKVSGKLCIPDPSCENGPAVMFADTVPNVRSRAWDFGDPSTAADTSTAAKPSYAYRNPGAYTVSLTRTLQNGSTLRTDTTITIGVPPTQFQNWRTDTMLCNGQKITLDPYPNGAPAGASYLWYPKGDTTRTIQVDSAGCYSVEVWIGTQADKQKVCSVEDRINVQVCGQRPQQQGAKWYFGNNAGIDFSGGSPSPLDDGKLNTIEGSSSISNTKGQLLFYTGGVLIYDKNGNLMKPLNPADTAQLQGSQTSTQSALIVPQPTCKGCEYLYRVYTTSEINGKKILSVSTVDMRYNQGTGAIIEKNTLVDSLTTERLASVRNDRDTTYWVISHDYGNNKFQVYHVTKAGVEGPEEYALGMPHDTTTKGEGYMKIGPADTTGNGNRPIAVVVPGPPTNYVEVFTFNDSTGVMTAGPAINIGPAPPKAYGVEFSPDGSKLYVSLQGDTANASQILIYDLTNPDPAAIEASKTVLDSTKSRQYGALQIGSDGKIYVAIKDGTSLGVIDNPNDELLAPATFDPNGLNLNGPTSQLGLPNMVANFNEPSNSPGFSYADTCAGSPTQFTVTPMCPPLKDNYTWNWGDNSAPFSSTATQATHTYNEPGVYSVSLRIVTMRSDGGICKDTVITQDVTIVRTPDPINLGPDIDSCKNMVTLDAKVEASVYIWIRNGRLIRGYNERTLPVTVPGSPGYNGIPPGRFIVIAANGGCFSSDTINVTLRRPPNFTLGPDTTLCLNSSLTLTARGNAWNSFRWSNGTTERATTITQAGTYSVIVRDVNGCENTDTVAVVALPKPVVTAFMTPPTGCTTTDGSIRLSVGSATVRRFEWRSGGQPLSDTTALLQGIRDGEYTVRIISDNACTVDTTLTLRSNNSIEVQANPQTALCTVPQSGSIRLTIVRGRPTEFIWRDANGAVVGNGSGLTGINGGIYSLEARDTGGCLDTLNNIRVPVDTTGFVSLGPDRGKCIGDTIQLSTLVRAPGDVYLWNSGQTTPSINVTTAGPYRLTVRNSITGCRGSDEVVVTFNAKPVVEAGLPQEICANSPSFTLSGATPLGGFWTGRGVDSTGRFTPADSLAGPNPIVLTYSASQGGCVAFDRKIVFVQVPPTVRLGPDTTLCPSPTLRLAVTASAGATYRWSTGATTSSIQPTTSGSYSVVATSGACTATDEVKLTFLPLPTFDLTREVPLCVGDQGRAVLQVSGNSTLTYFWPHSGDSTPRITVLEVGRYAVRVTGANGCAAVDTAVVVDKCEPRVVLPDAFTPNGDGNNDLLDVFTAYVTDFELRVFNRWGEVIFVSNDPEQKWDGNYRGQAYPSMVYAYTVNFKSLYYPERPKVLKRGSILLVR